MCIAEFWLYSDYVWEQAEELQEQRQGQWRTAEKKEWGCWTLMNPVVSIVVYGRSLSSCGRTRRMTCCPRGGMLGLTKTWPWGEMLDLVHGKPSLLSPLQENKQSPLLSIEEIQNGIQSPDGHKQLQVICWNLALFCVLLCPLCFLFSNLIIANLSSGNPVRAKDLEPWEEPSDRRDDQPRNLAQVFEPSSNSSSS